MYHRLLGHMVRIPVQLHKYNYTCYVYGLIVYGYVYEHMYIGICICVYVYLYGYVCMYIRIHELGTYSGLGTYAEYIEKKRYLIHNI